MKKKVLKYDSPFMTLGNFSKTSLDSGHYLFCIYKLHMHVHYSCIFMVCELSQASLFLYSELQLYIWSQPVAFFSPTLRLFSFPHPPLPFILPSSILSCHLHVSLTKGNSRKKDFSSFFSTFRT